jgi:hypothetical protein
MGNREHGDTMFSVALLWRTSQGRDLAKNACPSTTLTFTYISGSGFRTHNTIHMHELDQPLPALPDHRHARFAAPVHA